MNFAKRGENAIRKYNALRGVPDWHKADVLLQYVTCCTYNMKYKVVVIMEIPAVINMNKLLAY
jgi:hypothetical protein